MGDSWLTRSARDKLHCEDMEWLLKQPRSLEREHIQSLMKWVNSLSWDEIEMIEQRRKKVAAKGCNLTKGDM